MSENVESWGDRIIEPGQKRRLRLDIGKSFSGANITLPLMVWRGKEPGPIVGITGAVHGDEINGTGAIRGLIQDPPFSIKKGSLILVPVVNIMGFERHSRYMPDRRDLNRSFPGNHGGSLTSRLARVIFDQIVGRCDYLIDLHTAAIRRTNFPNVRADCENKECRRLAKAFGSEVIVNGSGPDGSLRSEAVRAGCPTIVLEAGEVWKVEPTVLELTIRGITNVLSELGMIQEPREAPPHQMVVEETRWFRSETGGFLHFHVSPGMMVSKGQALASSTGLLGKENEVIYSRFDGIVMGMTTMPAVGPGDPVVHIGIPTTSNQHRKMEKSIDGLQEGSIETEVRSQLATNITVTEI